jgi:hypothetical protein
MFWSMLCLHLQDWNQSSWDVGGFCWKCGQWEWAIWRVVWRKAIKNILQGRRPFERVAFKTEQCWKEVTFREDFDSGLFKEDPTSWPHKKCPIQGASSKNVPQGEMWTCPALLTKAVGGQVDHLSRWLLGLQSCVSHPKMLPAPHH